MHGVQPKAKAAPMTGGPASPKRFALEDSTRRSFITGISQLGVHTAVMAMNSPMATIVHPAMTVKIDWLK